MTLTNSVTLTAASVADNTKSVQVTFTIVTNNPNNAKLNGHYVFRFSGFDNNGNAVVRGGVFIADEKGNIPGGVQDSNNAATGPNKNQTISGTYNVGSDNRGTMTLGGVGYRFALGSIVSGWRREVTLLSSTSIRAPAWASKAPESSNCKTRP